jgi:hypothetical protein
LDRYFLVFEEGRLRDEICTARIDELSAKLASFDARRADLARGDFRGVLRKCPLPRELGEMRFFDHRMDRCPRQESNLRHPV